jgi:hypothetical protein
VFILSARPDILRPLDRRAFGLLKGHARQFWGTECYNIHGAKPALSQMVEKFILSWDRITPDLIDLAWDICEGRFISKRSDVGVFKKFRQRCDVYN